MLIKALIALSEGVEQGLCQRAESQQGGAFTEVEGEMEAAKLQFL